MRIKLDELLSQLGNPGRYQVFVFILLCLNYFPLLFNHVIMAFFGARLKHQCHSSLYETINISDPGVANVSDPSYSARILPKTADIGTCKSMYAFSADKNVTVTCPSSEGSVLVYDKPDYLSNIVTEWDLVCGRSYLSSLATTIYFFGVMVGGVVFGHLADKFGRKPVMLVCLFMPVLVGVATSFAPWYSVFVSLRFIQGILMQGLQTTTYTLAMELFLPHHRSYAGAILECVWGMAVMIIPLLAYLIPNWRHLQLVISLPSLLAVFYICLMPESLRWLVMKQKIEAAETQISKMAAWNKTGFPSQMWEDLKLQVGTSEPDKKQYSFLDLLKTPRLRKRSLILFYLWFAISVGYYGLTWKLTALPGNKYLNFFMAGAVEFVAYCLVIYIIKRFGRKRPLMVCFFMASLFMAGSGLVLALEVDMVYLSSGLAVAGKFFMGGLFSTIFLYTSEIYPTIIRNIGMGSCAFWTRLGGVVAPQILFLDKFGNKALPLILFAVITCLGGFLMFLLPETLGTKLPDAISDVENHGSHGDLKEDDKSEEMKNLNP